MSQFIRHEPCECGSSDGKAVYSDGHTYCFVCHSTTQEEEHLTDQIEKPVSLEQIKKLRDNLRPLPEEFSSWNARGFSAKTVAKFLVNVGQGAGKCEAVYPFFDKEGKHVANKLRFPGKEFVIQGDWKASGLFGQQAFPAGSSKQITLVEGQDDAMAVYEMQGYPSVSVHSASSAKRDVANQFEYLNAFEQIVVAFDSDAPGQAAAQEVAGMFKPGKVRLLKLEQFKDANDYLKAGKAREFSKEWWAAAPFTPAGLKLGSQMWEDIRKPREYDTVSYPWTGLNYMTYGIRLSEFILFNAPTKVGKTTILKEIGSHLLHEAKKEYGIGGIFLEETNVDTILGLCSIEANKPLHLPDIRAGVPEEDMRRYYDAAANTDRLVLWDHFGSNTIDGLLDKIRHMHALGCKYILLDHISIVVSDQSGDERKQLDEISTKLKMLCMELNIAVIAVIHQSRSGLVRGSAGPEQIANITIRLNRDLEDEDEWRRNVTKVVVSLNRFCGRTGPACYLWYDPTTGRMNELTPEEGKRYEGKPSAKGEF